MRTDVFRDALHVAVDDDGNITFALDDHDHFDFGPRGPALERGQSRDVLDAISDTLGRDIGWIGDGPDTHSDSRDDGTEAQALPPWKETGEEKPGNGKGNNKEDDGTTDTTDDGTTDTTDDGTTTVTASNDASEPAPQYAIDSLLSGYSWGSGPLTINFSFLDALPSYYDSTAPEANDFSSFTAAQETAARSALAEVSEVANVTFVETANSDAQITFANASLGSGVAAWAYYPYTNYTASQAGDVWVNSDYSFNFSPADGNLANLVLLHELGHAMGLSHPQDGSVTLPSSEDSRQYTVESYNKHPGMGGIEPQSYMSYDIAALQSLYGANMETGAGDDVYDFSTVHNRIESIWDAGGVDTFDASGRSDSVVLDLTSGGFSSIGTYGTGYAAVDNISVAYNVTIENAVGGSGSDVLIGNAASNVLTGGAGTDHFVFEAGWGNDAVTDFEDGSDLLDFRAAGLSFADLTIADGSDGASVSFGDDTITVAGVAASAIDSSDFLFA